MPNRAPNRRGADSRRKLLDAGLAAFHASGYTATGVDEISKSAQIPKGSFYNHFGSKQAFGAEVVDLYFERHLAKLHSFLGDRDRAPVDRLRAYFEERTGFFAGLGCKRGCMMGNLSLEAADHSEVLREHLAQHFGTWSALFAATIREAQEAGAVRSHFDADRLADFILNSWEGALLRMKAERSTKPLDDAQAVIFGSVLT
ncbi:TetR family transcriptional regulator C-terminal domain-containing protein [Methylobacterium sp. Gmos1]